MSSLEFLERLRSLDITLRLEGEQLRIDAPSGALTTALREELVARKAELVNLLRAAASRNAGRSSIERVPRDGSLPLSHGQERLWLLDQLQPNSAAYVLRSALRLRGPLDVQVLTDAVNCVVRRHETLRTVFTAEDGVPRQVIRPHEPRTVKLIDLESHSPKVREDEALRLAAADALLPMDLAAGPLLRVQLLRLSSEDHVLLITVHHIVFDGWSATIFMRELGAFYRAQLAGKPHDSLEPALQFVDFASWQRQVLNESGRAAQLAYWREQLKGDRSPLDLPADRPRPEGAGAGEHVPCELPAENVRALDALCRSVGATRSMGLLALLQLLLHRLTGETDVVVGTPIAGRTRSETETMIGFFMNTVVMRALFDRSLSFRKLLEQVRDTSLGAYANQDMPFDELVNALEPQRDIRRTPLFQVFFNYLNIELPDLQLPDVTVERFGEHIFESRFDLTVYAYDEGATTRLVAAYNADLFDAARMREFLNEYRVLLEQVVAEPDRDLADLSLVTPEAIRVLPDGAGPMPIVGAGGTLTFPHLGEHGMRVALTATNGDWTYRDLHTRADLVARRLVAAGVQRGDVVAVFAARTPELVCALLGVLRSGAAFAILDPAYPEVTLAERCRAAQPRALLMVGAQPHAGGALEAAIVPGDVRVRLELTLAALGGAAPDVALPEVRADDLAYIAFTSGTEGGVKAIAGTHGPVAHFLDWQRKTFGLGANDRFTLLSGLAHDPLLRDVFAPLACGAVLCVPSDAVWREPADLAKWLWAARATAVHLTPPLAQLLVSELGDTRVYGSSPLVVWRHAFFGGDVLTTEIVEKIRYIAPHVRMVNFYGATETPQAMSYHIVDTADEAAPGRIPIGRGIDGVQLLVLTTRNRLAGIGELGEIVVRTPYLARGYLANDGLTAQRFAVNPLTAIASDRVYCTGDLGRFMPSGAVTFSGRRDRQVKVRGFRVELGEIEAVLRSASGVSQAAVTLQTEGAEPRLVAYVVAAGTGTVDPGVLRETLHQRLPHYAVPTAFVAMQTLPLTPNGKLDYRALPKAEMPSVHFAFEAPQTATEDLVAAVYGNVLGRNEIGREDNFFELGGHSLLGARVVARIRAQLGVNLPLRALFEAPTPRRLASRIEAAKGQGAPELPLRRRDPGNPALSFAQQRLWFLAQLNPASTAYLLSGAVVLAGELAIPVLERVVDDIVQRHEVLRTVFKTRAGIAHQEILPASPMRLVIENFADRPDEERATEVQRRASAIAQEPMDLAQGPLLRLHLLRESEERHVLVLAVHHSVFDGWSGGVLVRELAVLYRAYRAGDASPLAQLPIQYADYSVWQRQLLQGEVLEGHLRYWRKQMAGAPPNLAIPTDRPRPPVVTYRGSRYSFKWPRKLSESLTALARREGVTLFMALVTAFKVVLARYSGQRDIVIGSPVANRNRPELEGLIGFFVNTLVLRSDVDLQRTFGELLHRVRETCLGAYSHQDLPFERLVEELQPPRDTSRNPLFQVMFALQNMELPALKLPGLSIAPYAVERGTSQVDLALYMHESEGLHGTFEYSTDLFDRETIDRLAGCLRMLLEAVIASPEAAVGTLPLLSEEQQHMLLQTFNATYRDYEKGLCLHELIERSIDHHGPSVALECEGELMSYAELETRANQLAHYLRDRGVGPDVLVGICAERSIELVVALLGVLKAGGAYVPLDPEYPAERLAFMVEDCKTPVLLTQERLLARLPPFSAEVVCLDRDWPAVGSYPLQRLPAVSGPDNLAYIIYTSGSTGRPKGAMNEHRAIVNRLQWMQEQFGLGPNDRVLQKTPSSFDVSVWEFFWPLLTGAKMVLAKPGGHRDPAYLAKLIERAGITVLHFVPSMLQVFLAQEGLREKCRGVRVVVCSGEALHYELQEKFLSTVDAELHNLYGPTEVAVDVTHWECRPDVQRRVVPIGRPIANTQIYILNEQLRAQPIGVAGELHIGGVQVGRGYWNREQLTAERFIDDPFRIGGRLYKTGDAARYRADGVIEFLGRLDQQVKIRGFRIELGEIETALMSCAGIKEAAATVADLGGEDRRLVAYVVTADGRTTLEDAQVRAQLRVSLPEYMVPQHFVTLERLPLSPSGKLDRKALPTFTPSSSRGIPYVSPRTPTEQAIAAAYGEVLSIDRVGAEHNFFELGGHSLLVAKLAAIVRERLSIELPIRAVFDAPTVEGLARYVDVIAWSSQERGQKVRDEDDELARFTL